MARKTSRLAGVFANSLARLIDLAPPEMVVSSEDEDMAVIGGDFRDAIDAVVPGKASKADVPVRVRNARRD